MTLNGEELTLKGEFINHLETVFSFNKQVTFSYSRDIEDSHKVRSKDDFPKPKMPVFQMIFLLKGSLELVNTNENVVYGRIESQQHNLLRIDPETDRMILTGAKDDEIFCINLNNSFLNRYLPDSHPALQLITGQLNDEQPARLFPENMYITPEISAILLEISRLSGTGFCNQLILKSKVINLLALQISQFEQVQTNQQPSALKNEELERMQQAREILINNNGEKLTLRALAHRVGTNEFTLKRDFKLAFGTTVYGYLNQFKMEQAKSMLIEKNITITELSAKMGYKYPTHFSNAFKKYFGFLPNKIISGKMQY